MILLYRPQRVRTSKPSLFQNFSRFFLRTVCWTESKIINQPPSDFKVGLSQVPLKPETFDKILLGITRVENPSIDGEEDFVRLRLSNSQDRHVRFHLLGRIFNRAMLWIFVNLNEQNKSEFEGSKI